MQNCRVCFWHTGTKIQNIQQENAVNVETVVKIVKATCVLHNFLHDRNLDVANIYTRLNPERLEYLSANGTVVNLQHLLGYRSTEEAQRIRRVFTTYFNGVAGILTW